jgi:iron complex transport system permease protein
MSTITTPLAIGRRRTLPRLAGLPLCATVLAAVVLLSIAVGAKAIPLGDVIRGLLGDDGSESAAIIRELRVPRTLIGLTVGVGLGLAGALMQALTRNPLADPGILGVEAGAAAAIVTAIGVLGLTEPREYVWFSFAGAAVASVVVYALGSRGRAAATPVRLALAGVAVTYALTAFTNAMILLDQRAFDEYRHWVVGSLAGRDFQILADVGPFLAVGVLLALALARPLNALALGDDSGRALGAGVGRTRALGALSITLMCGAATAIAGPIVFIGLVIPHMARAIVGPDQRWVLAYSALLAPILLLTADIVGRIVISPAELEVGVVTAVIGAPVFIALVRRKRIAQL